MDGFWTKLRIGMAPMYGRRILKNQTFPPEAAFRDLCSFRLPFWRPFGSLWFPFGSEVDDFRTIRDPFGLHFASFWPADLKLIRTRFSNGLGNHLRGRSNFNSISDNLRFMFRIDNHPKLSIIICCEAKHQNRKHLRAFKWKSKWWTTKRPCGDHAATRQRPCGDRTAAVRCRLYLWINNQPKL